MGTLLLQSNALHIPLADGSVDCVVTSPPYWNLRNYQAKNQLGQEKSYLDYVKDMVHVFAEVHRVLKSTGTLWLNLGDSFAGSGGAHKASHKNPGLSKSAMRDGLASPRPVDSLPPKNLIGIPWRVALALQEFGWILRSDIIWARPNPMPESVKTRPTKSHEYLFLLVKSGKYYYDADAIAVPSTTYKQSYQSEAKKGGNIIGNMSERGVTRTTEGLRLKSRSELIGPTKNRRDVWTIPTSNYRGSHFATYPDALVEPCILAGCPTDGIVLDPFCGSGTTVMVAKRLGRRGIGLDLSYSYLHDLAKIRIEKGK